MLETKEGQKVPSVTFKTRKGNEWIDVKSDDLFNGKKVILFSLPGAFTPTCSTSHLPRYNQLAPVFKKNGIDNVICISVNDAFVMNSWGVDQEADNITLIPDGNGEFTEGMGMLVDKSAIGFGKRSWRYSMYVEDGVVKKMFIEPEKPGDPFEVSDAETMMKSIFPETDNPKEISLFTRAGCPHCARAKKLLGEKGWDYEEIPIGREISIRSLRTITGKETVPQIYINGEHIGGADELESYLK